MIKLYTLLVRKPMNYEQILSDQKQLLQNFHSHPEEFKIETIVELSKEEFEEFKSNLLVDRDFIKEHDDIFLVKEKGTSNTSGIIVDAQGYDYVRYAGLPMERCDIKKCPRCSKYFIEPPALSRKDNKTEICSSCGVEEALESLGYDKDFLEFLKTVQNASDRYNAQVFIKTEGREDILIEPNK